MAQRELRGEKRRPRGRAARRLERRLGELEVGYERLDLMKPVLLRLSPELHDELRRRGEGIGLTTVYRTLQSMAAAGLVDTLSSEGPFTVFAPTDEAFVAALEALDLTAEELLADIATAAARSQRHARDEALRASRFDALTGLYNRSFFFTTMEQELRRSDRMGRGFTMLMLDLDDLKPVNDTFGHQWGARLLKAIADTGGTVGVIFATGFLRPRGGPKDADVVVDHLAHIVSVVGDDFASLGSDLDGAITPPRDLRSVGAYARLVQKMLDRGWSAERICKIMGQNFLRVVESLRG